ncbi:MAG: SDR family NAD(P)-dependent oxidoreductase [Actinobacteria bacterium]|nr:SDR family NAD(P)-dependent oxidoreductase [Actinomycetota bacterium]MBW3646775.1 SDR family NAD(P)-dependent oxidoreductase [Actinomycetota bacterium]
MGLLDGKVAIVTGAGRGLGRGEALELAREGAAVVVGEVDEAAGSAVVDEIRAGGGRAVLHPGDCSEIDVAEAIVDVALEQLGRLDALVNNAGILRDRTVLKMTPEEWDAVIKVHLRGHYAPTHAAVRHWREIGQSGRVVCTASTSGILGNFGQSNYGAAKAGIAAFAQIVAQEGWKYGITVNAICPAARTRMTEGAYGDRLPGPGGQEEFDFWHPDNVAPFVAFLCSDASSHISGKVFGVQGDTVELYRPYTSEAAIDNGGVRWTAEQVAERVAELFAATGMAPEAQNGMARLRYTMTTRQ